MANINGYINKVTNFRDGTSTNDNCPIIAKLKKGTEFIIIGQVGDWFYIESSDGDVDAEKGFVKKSAVTYITLNSYRRVMDKNKTYDLQGKLYNAPKSAAINWKIEDDGMSASNGVIDPKGVQE